MPPIEQQPRYISLLRSFGSIGVGKFHKHFVLRDFGKNSGSGVPPQFLFSFASLDPLRTFTRNLCGRLVILCFAAINRVS